MNAHSCPAKLTDTLAPVDFSWGDIQEDGRGRTGDAALIAGSIEATAFPSFLAGGLSARDLAQCPRLREWLLSGTFARLHVPEFPGASFHDYRDLALAILSAVPDMALIFTAKSSSGAYRRAALFWGEADEAPTLPTSAVLEAGADDMLAALQTAALELRRPEEPYRVAQRLNHLRKAAAAPSIATESDTQTLRKGASAANAVIPATPAAPAEGLHLGSGIVLRPAAPVIAESLVSEALGFQLTPTLHGDGEARLDPAPGKVLKHESMHALFVAEDGRVRVAMGALRVAGHTARHIFATSSESHLCAPGLFCFNEAWQFVGMTVRAFAPDAAPGLPRQATALLRATAIWDDLVGRADLGCARSADMLHQLSKTRPAKRRVTHLSATAPLDAIGDR